MDGIGGLLLAVALLVGLPAWALWDRRRARTRSLFRTTARSSVSGARDGRLTKLVGTVRYDRPPLHAPLTGRTCALYSITVKKEENALAFETTHRECRCCGAFQLEDSTGCALVRLIGAGDAEPGVEASFEEPMVFSQAWHEPAEGRLRRFIAERGLPEGSPTSLRLFEEGIVREGDTVAVVGLARFEIDRAGPMGQQPYREAAHVVTLHAPPETVLLISTEGWAR